jgi:hypothetical protein
MTHTYSDAVSDGSREKPLGFRSPGGFDRWLAAWSAAGACRFGAEREEFADEFDAVGLDRH